MQLIYLLAYYFWTQFLTTLMHFFILTQVWKFCQTRIRFLHSQPFTNSNFHFTAVLLAASLVLFQCSFPSNDKWKWLFMNYCVCSSLISNMKKFLNHATRDKCSNVLKNYFEKWWWYFIKQILHLTL